ncbi:uncharacterized protein VICG_00176 [Vittaforma corneae ATCC 50505]|uniref:Uncharacterized protein n=1 Tax=Vittaforma corneae (strain ATCC 50505) TaxID=993615 RepID=L2GPU2_VITCO|nr:uncharacterized protein VICG_00176 [Vittaforma corneae ATCC 50505]ELA42861.1 hypothetical protein VICG_00176 [Vittaforma corneae ATCC 50505]
MTILLDEKTIALAQASNTGFPTAENSGWSKSIDLCEMAALQNFELYSSVLESLAFRKMSMLHKLLLKDCLLTSATLQDVSSLLDVFLESCHLKSLSLQTVHALKNLNLIMSSFESIDLQEVQSIENLGFFKCDLLNMHSICMGLKTTKSLKCLVIDECTGFMKLPYEISEISGLEVLHLDLKQLDSVDVGKYTSESEEPDCVQLKESFRLPSTLRDCSIYVNNDLVKSIMGIWFEKCDRSQLRLVINENDYVVTDDYQIVRRE